MLWPVIWQNVLANIVGVSCAEWRCRRQFFHEVFGKGLASRLPQSHHVTLPRCGCSHIDVEDVDLWACWICYLKVFSF